MNGTPALAWTALIVRAADPAADPTALDAAARLLRSGGLVAFPTETVYGLGADATDATALRRIFTAKGRPPDHPLIVHVASTDEAVRWAGALPAAARRLADAFWPGPLTLVVPRGPAISPTATGGRDTVGLRVPDHPVALELLARTDRPVAAPSANRFGRVSPTTAADVVAEFAGASDGPALVLDGGPCTVGVESTILEVLGDAVVLLRPGGLPVEFVEDELGMTVRTDAGPARASGMLPSHYAPHAAVELIAPGSSPSATGDAVAAVVAARLAAGATVAVLGAPDEVAEQLGARLGRLLAGRPGGRLVDLGAVGDVAGYARSLYRRLRDADEAGVDCVVAVLPPAGGLGRAVRDRLQKAAAPRP